MKNKHAQQTTIIGGADGPVSVFIAHKDNHFRRSIKDRLRNKRCQMRRQRAEKRIRPGAHTKEETVVYAKEKYGFISVDPNHWKYISNRKDVKAGIIYKYMPQLLGSLLTIAPPDISHQKSLQEYRRLIDERERKIELIPDEAVPMDFQMYERIRGDGHLEIVLDDRWDIFGVSYSCNKKLVKKYKNIAKDIYSFYGVNKEDIENKTERFQNLVCAMSDF